MFEEYKKKLLAFYLHKKGAHQLSGNLENLQRSNLRKECLHVFSEKNTKKDQEIIRAFFDSTGRFNDAVTSIERVELDKFRPLVSFLQEEKNIRDEASVKLLAWLIDFDSYEEWRLKQATGQSGNSSVDEEDKGGGTVEVSVPGENKPVGTSGKDLTGNNESVGTGETVLIGNDESVGTGETVLIGDDNDRGKRKFLQKALDIIIGRPFSIKNAAVRCMVFLVLAGTVFFLVEKNTGDTIRQPLAEEKCMYWTGNHYEPVKCDEKIENATVIPLNLHALANLKRIDLTDTLTSYSLGKVWYSKVDGKREFFTDSGMHPVDASKRLRPLSKYILSNYVSYYRYLLTHLVWLICVVVAFVLCMVCIVFLRKKKD